MPPVATTSGVPEPSDDGSTSEAARAAFVGEVMAAVGPTLTAAGFDRVHMHPRGSYIRARFPESCGLQPASGAILIKATKSVARCELVLDGFATRDENAAALDALRAHLGDRVAELPHPVGVWRSGIGDAVRAIARSELAAGGYAAGSPATTAAWAETQALGWLTLLQSAPMPISDAEPTHRNRSAATTK
jgi:hypothetical protein